MAPNGRFELRVVGGDAAGAEQRGVTVQIERMSEEGELPVAAVRQHVRQDHEAPPRAAVARYVRVGRLHVGPRAFDEHGVAEIDLRGAVAVRVRHRRLAGCAGAADCDARDSDVVQRPAGYGHAASNAGRVVERRVDEAGGRGGRRRRRGRQDDRDRSRRAGAVLERKRDRAGIAAGRRCAGRSHGNRERGGRRAR